MSLLIFTRHHLNALVKRLISAAIGLTLLCPLSQADTVIRYPSPGKNFKEHHTYPLALLELALEKNGQAFTLRPSDTFMHQGRALKQLATGKDIQVLWTMTSKQREAELIPIRIPLYKGLIGWRVFLSSKTPILNPNRVFSLSELKTFETIQGHDWPDTRILSHNGFNIQNSPSYDGLFTMLSLGRADLFPRSIIEVWDEVDKYKTHDVGIEPHTLIRYPTASYFFVSPNNKALAHKIEHGLRSAIKDGSFEALFQENFATPIAKANLEKRTHYRLDNPLLPAGTPVQEKDLWFKSGSQ